MSCKRVTGSWQTKIITVDKMLNSELWTRLSLRPPEVEPLSPVAAWELPGKEDSCELHSARGWGRGSTHCPT